MKRIVLFLLTNLAVLLVLTIVLRVLGVDRFLTQQGIDFGALLAFSAVVGFAGSIISLLLSKPMARWSTGAHVITEPGNATEQWLMDTVTKLASRAGISMPEVAIYEGGAERIRDRRFQEQRACRGIDRPHRNNEPRRGRGGARP